MKRLVLLLGHRAVDVVRACAGGPRLIVARLHPGHLHIDALVQDNRRDGIEKGKRVIVRQRVNRRTERGRGQRAGGHDHAGPIRGR